MKFKIAALFAAAILITSSTAEEKSGTPYDVEQEFTQGGTTNEVKASGELPPPSQGSTRRPIVEDETEMTNDESNPTEPPAPKETEEEGESGSGEARRARDIIVNTDVDYSITYIYNDDPESNSHINGHVQAEIFNSNSTVNSTADPTNDFQEIVVTLTAIDLLIFEIQSTDYDMLLSDDDFAFLYEIFVGPIPEDDNAQDDLFPLTEAEMGEDESPSSDADADADVDADADADMDADSSDADEGLDQENIEEEGADEEVGEDDEQEEENENEEEDEDEQDDDEVED